MSSAVKSPKRLLVVDDEASLRSPVTLVLRHAGYDVTVATTVAAALEQISSQNFDALICDLKIQEPRDGYTVVRAIRQVNRKCVVIILTGYPDVETAVEGIHAGVDDYLIKPVAPETFLAALRARLAAREPTARILSVSSDQPLLRTRHMLLEREGYEVVSAIGLAASLQLCKEGDFDVFVLGHSLPYSDKKKLVDEFRKHCPAPIISLRRNAGEQLVDGADYHIEPDPEPLLQLVADLVHRKFAAAD